jgi:hypothetical protein
MTATGFAFLASPLLVQFDSPVLRTAGLMLPNVWLLLLVAIVLTFLSGGRLRTRMDRVLVGAVALDLLTVTPLSLFRVPLADSRCLSALRSFLNRHTYKDLGRPRRSVIRRSITLVAASKSRA